MATRATRATRATTQTQGSAINAIWAAELTVTATTGVTGTPNHCRSYWVIILARIRNPHSYNITLEACPRWAALKRARDVLSWRTTSSQNMGRIVGEDLAKTIEVKSQAATRQHRQGCLMMKLFAACIGGEDPGVNIAVHDMRLVVATSVEGWIVE